MVIGFDLGGKNSVCAVTRAQAQASGRNFIDIAIDEASKRQVHCFVGFPEKERVFGNGAQKEAKQNLQNTIQNPYKILGKSLAEVQDIVSTSHVRIVSNPRKSLGGVEKPCYLINYQNEDVTITPEHAIAILLKHQYNHAKMKGTLQNEAVLTIPNNLSYAARAALLKAGEIAKLKVLGLCHSTYALSLDAGYLGAKNRGDHVIMYVDMGYSGVNVGAVRFFEGGWHLLCTDTFTRYSGEHLEKTLIQSFSDKFKSKYGEGFASNGKAVTRALDIIPKLLKNLVANKGVHRTVEYFYKEKDFKFETSREELAKLLAPATGELEKFLRSFCTLAKSKLKKNEKFECVETVGMVCRMVDLRTLLKKIFMEELGCEIKTTLNIEEAVARGAVLQCCVLSPNKNILQQDVKDILPFQILVSRTEIGFPVENWRDLKYSTLFPLFHELDKSKTITFKKPKSYLFLLIQENQRKERSLIGSVVVDCDGVVLEEGESWSKMQVIVHLTKNGLLNIRTEVTKTKMEQVEVEKEEEVPLTEEEYAEACKKAEEEAQKKAEEEAKKKEEEKKKAAEKAEKNPEKMDVDKESAEKVEPEKKSEEKKPVEPKPVEVKKFKTVKRKELKDRKKTIKTEISTEFIETMAMEPKQLKEIMELENKMTKYDSEVLAVAASRNNLEEYVLSGEADFAEGGDYYEFMTKDERNSFMDQMLEMEDFLGEDNYELSAQEYETKLGSLKKVGDLIVIRQREHSQRPKALEYTKKQMNIVEQWIQEGRKKEEYVHIKDELVKELEEKLTDCSKWLDEKMNISQKLKRDENPPFRYSEVMDKCKEIQAAFNALKLTPKPEPPKEEEKDKKEAESKKEGDEVEKEVEKADGETKETKKNDAGDGGEQTKMDVEN